MHGSCKIALYMSY